MSYLNDILKAYPKIHKYYVRGYHFHSQWTVHLPLKFQYLRAKLKGPPKITVLSYPELPHYFHILYKICHLNNWRLTHKVQAADVIVHFEDTTFRKYDKVMNSLKKKHRVVNIRCLDISKSHVEKIHRLAFGYGISINPQTYKGRYVKKEDLNSLHNGQILDRPEKPQPGFVYQRLIEREVNGELLEYRVPIVGQKIPFIWLKHKKIDKMFHSQNRLVEMVEPLSVLSQNEYDRILKFCRLYGLDLGELDVLRDIPTKRIYVVDANNTPGGPPYSISMKLYIRGLQMMSIAFRQAFLKH